MIVRRQNTYACITATAISKIVINSPTLNGNNAPIAKIPPAVNKFQVKTDKIVNNKCPAVIFAANRKPKDKALPK